jgi:hypothetical protein
VEERMKILNRPWIEGVIALLLILIFTTLCNAFCLPDTGQTTCYNNRRTISIISCPNPGNSLAQDGSYTINPPSYSTSGNGTVSDNNTHLTWQQEDDNAGKTWHEAYDYCENLSLGGFTDWRLPTKKELVSIIKYEQINPAIDSGAFPGTDSYLYWTSSTPQDYQGGTWVVYFTVGEIMNGYKSDSGIFTRCVRGEPLTFHDYADNGDGTVTDDDTGLIWQQGEAGLMDWGTALKYCEGLSLGGYTDWRLPNVKELESLTTDIKYGLAIDMRFFPGASASNYWSSTSFIYDYYSAWPVNFVDGTSHYSRKTNAHNVRCVRKGKTHLDDGEITFNTESIGFGIVSLGSSSTTTLTMSNIGSAVVQVYSIAGPSAPFSIISDGCSGQLLSPLSACSVTALFSPVQSGMFTDKMIISSSDADHSQVIVNIAGNTSFLFPDTGYTKCHDADCPPPGNPEATDGSYLINPPSQSSNGDGTVSDNNTGLMWQQADDNQAYNWYKASGTYHKRYNRNTSDVCGSLTLGGYTDWRLPAIKELESIVHYGKSGPSIDSSAFSNTKSNCYWSADSYAANPTSGWVVSFDSGQITQNTKESNCYARCVRGEFDLNAFVNNNNGTITDKTSGLMWLQYPPGVDEGAGSAYCEGLNYAGFSDWRLPNIRELASLTDFTKTGPPLNTAFFPRSYSEYDHAYFWSSTGSWFIDLIYNGSTGYYIDYNTRLACALGGGMGTFNCGSFARCVRNITYTPAPATLSGTVTDSSTGLPVSNVAVSITDSAGHIHTTVTDPGGKYSVLDLPGGTFAAAFEKPGYIRQVLNGSLTAGEIRTLNIQLTPLLPLTVTITSPVDGAALISSPVTVTGNVSNNAQVTVNGIPATVSNDMFAASVPLNEGLNSITAAANDIYGQTASQTIYVTLETHPAISNVVAVNITSDKAEITWTTSQPSDGLVEYGETAAYGNSVSDGTMVSTHSMTITGLKVNTTYHFRVTSKNSFGLTSSSGDNTFATLNPPFTATTLGDYGNVTVMEVTGSYDAKNPDGSLNMLSRQPISKEFLKAHQDTYDFFVIFSNFDFQMPDAGAKGFYTEVKNDIQGIGRPLFDNSSFFGSNGKLQGIIDMGDISKIIMDPADPRFEETISTLAHEQMHRWGANVKFKDASGNMSTALLGKDGCHWSFLLDSDASVLYGNDWRDNGDGTFTSTGANRYYSPLDLYLMGFYDKSQVPQTLLIENKDIDPAKLPEIGTTISGAARYITIDDIIAAEGQRVPDALSSQKAFKTAFIFITRPGTFNDSELAGIENIRNAWAGRFAALTYGEGSVVDTPPSITITIASPADGETIAGNKVMVRGSIINSAGDETGVTVNGAFATVYGNQFMANVSLQEGSNTITATATDTEGNTASTSITVNAMTTGNYIRLISNIESGIAPLEATLRIDGSFSIENSSVTVSGPVQPEITQVSADEYTVRMTVEGIYNITASVTGPDGNVYQNTVVINVMNRTQLDNLLKKKWEEMNSALTNQDVEKASTFYSEETKQIYSDLFTALYDYLPQISQEMQEIQLIYLKNNTAKYRMRSNELYGGRYITLTYYIYFVIDKDGIWKIYRY